MEAILNSGIVFIVWFQSLGSWLVAPMKFFSFLGSEEFFLLAFPLIYWCMDTGIALRIGTIVLFAGSANEILKLSFHGPRPYWFSTQVKAYSSEATFGLPSGHAQIATSLWGTAALQIKRYWAWLVAIFIIIMIGLSRLFLAVHFPHDVLAGWAIGILTVWAYASWWQPVTAWARNKSLGQQIGLAFAVSMLIIVFGLIAYGSLQRWVLPSNWLANAQAAGVDVLPAPVSLSTTFASAAVLFGLLSGVAWTNSRGGFETSGSFNQRGLRLLPGLAGILIFYLGLRIIFPQGDMPIAYLLRYVRFALVGFWISGGAPWVFVKLNLAKKKPIA